jgi:alginate O-acetyltransferase complex protein AlgI
MLFTSEFFIFVFLPLTFLGFHFFRTLSHTVAIWWLILASFIFYGWWKSEQIVFLLGSIIFNYGIAQAITRTRVAGLALVLGVATNLLALTYYKYADFVLLNVTHLFDFDHVPMNSALPLGISFFTFTQIAFLVDSYRREARESDMTRYTLFVAYFPHLIAGPLVHHRQLMPQFFREATTLTAGNVAVGLCLFSIGLAKKLLVADPISQYVDPVFDSSMTPGLLCAWTGALAYTFQIYFDFSGYSDMAVGMSRFFGITLPVNFNSPYKATSIIDFWRRWHMTLSAFLKDYLYIPLGGSRRGAWRRYANIMVTMLLGGLWHGANWTFLIWGGVHGVYLCVNHLWRAAACRLGLGQGSPSLLARVVGTAATFAAVIIAWAFFRAPSLEAGTRIVLGMLHQNEGASWQQIFGDLSVTTFLVYLCGAMVIAFLLPNSNELMERFMQTGGEHSHPTSPHTGRVVAIVSAILFCTAVLTQFGTTQKSPFIYFQF